MWWAMNGDTVYLQTPPSLALLFSSASDSDSNTSATTSPSSPDIPAPISPQMAVPQEPDYLASVFLAQQVPSGQHQHRLLFSLLGHGADCYLLVLLRHSLDAVALVKAGALHGREKPTLPTILEVMMMFDLWNDQSLVGWELLWGRQAVVQGNLGAVSFKKLVNLVWKGETGVDVDHRAMGRIYLWPREMLL